MSTRNYRVMKKLNDHGNYELGIYEVYYDINRQVIGWTDQPVTPSATTEKELLLEIEQMQLAFKEETLLHK